MSNEILIISSTNRPDAVSRTVANIYQSVLAELDQKSHIIDLQELPADFIGSALYANSGKNEDFNPIRQKMLEAKKYVFIIPEYNGSFPGVLKTFVDGLAFPDTFPNKKAALVGIAAGTQGANLAMSHFTDILNYCGTHVLATKPRFTKISEHLEEEQLSKDYQNLLEMQAKAFVNF